MWRAELLVDGIYGPLPDRPKGVLERIQNNGRHLLALIHDVLNKPFSLAMMREAVLGALAASARRAH